jgi:hypothetical protein
MVIAKPTDGWHERHHIENLAVHASRIEQWEDMRMLQ